jgi:hypothetical protein
LHKKEQRIAWGNPWKDAPEIDENIFDNDDNEEFTDAIYGEAGAAYGTLSEFHAGRGEFQEAESLALQAAAFGTTHGLETLSHEMLQRGDRDRAEHFALWAVNMVSGWHLDDSSWAALALARADDNVPMLGLNADGATAPPW